MLFTLSLAGLARGASAQGQGATPTRSEARNLTVAYTPGGPRQNGYADAQALVRYWFQDCIGGVNMLAAIDPTPHLVVEPARYWIDGREVQLSVGHPRPRTPNFTIRGTVRGNGGARSISIQPDDRPSCMMDGQLVGQKSDFWPPKTSDAERVRILNGLSFDHDGASVPLRNPTVESQYRAQWAQEQRDSLARATVARRDSLERVSQARRDSVARTTAARRDSVDRAQAARREAAQSSASGARPGAGASGAAGSTAGAAGAAAGTTTGGGPLTRAERQQQAREQAIQQQEAARQQQVERRMAQEAERERQAESERQRRAESAAQVARMLEETRQREEERQRQVDQAAAAIGGFVGSVLQARAEDNRRNEERAQRAAETKERYMASALAFYTAYGPRPRCTPSDAGEALQLDGEVTGVLTGGECRLADNTSAILYTLTLVKRQKVELKVIQSQFYSRLYVMGPGTNLKGSGQIEETLNAGTYTVTVATEGPGERGQFTLATRRGQLSKTDGLSLSMVATSGGPNIASTTLPGHDSQVEFRAGLGFGDYVTLLAQYVLPQQYTYGLTATEFGARGYLRRRHSALRPWVQYLYGSRSILVERPRIDETYTGNGGAYGGGVEYFVHPKLGAEVSVLMASGTVQRDGTGTELSMSQTRLSLGFTWHP
jgi:hypothetical protein